MRDITNVLDVRRAISPVSESGNTALVSQIIDRQGYDSLMFAIAIGSVADADVTFTILVEDGDDSGLSDAAAVADGDLNGTEVLAGFRYDKDNQTRKIGYVGSKRYVRLTITPANNSGAAVIAAVAILGHPALGPTSNPPA